VPDRFDEAKIWTVNHPKDAGFNFISNDALPTGFWQWWVLTHSNRRHSPCEGRRSK